MVNRKKLNAALGKCALAAVVGISLLLVAGYLSKGFLRYQDIRLQNRYGLNTMDDAAYLYRDNEFGTRIIVVDPNIDAYGVAGHVLVGHRSEAESERGNPDRDTRYGYFILDMRNGIAQQGLTKAELAMQLRQKKLPMPQRLQQPRFRMRLNLGRP